MKPAIIGVVGKSNVDLTDSFMRELLKSAWQVGRLIAERGHIVLTGGHHKAAEHSVKHLAILGALDWQTRGQRVGVIGIPPEEISLRLKFTKRQIENQTSDDKRLQWHYPHTFFPSRKRNQLTGRTPDVLVALYGTAGTAEEIDEALAVGRKVILLEPSDDQRKLLSSNPDNVFEASSEIAAIERAIGLAGNGAFPDHKDLDKAFCSAVREGITSLREWVSEEK